VCVLARAIHKMWGKIGINVAFAAGNGANGAVVTGARTGGCTACAPTDVAIAGGCVEKVNAGSVGFGHVAVERQRMPAWPEDGAPAMHGLDCRPMGSHLLPC